MSRYSVKRTLSDETKIKMSLAAKRRHRNMTTTEILRHSEAIRAGLDRARARARKS